jgi:hypothetical protein
MGGRERARDEAPAGDDASPEEESSPGRATRPPGEGPARDGGSGLAADEEPAEEEIGGGD